MRCGRHRRPRTSTRVDTLPGETLQFLSPTPRHHAAARQEPALVSPGSDRTPTTRELVALETPLFFDSGGRPLYGVYHAPVQPRAGAPVLVQCHSLGVEQIALYRAEV